jgi:hypothetical protein
LVVNWFVLSYISVLEYCVGLGCGLLITLIWWLAGCGFSFLLLHFYYNFSVAE